jgi:hypothetical protein
MDTLNLPDRIGNVIPIHHAIPARLSPEYRKGMQQIVIEGLAERIADVSQSLDMTPSTPVPYGSLAPEEQVRANDAARCALRWCDPREHKDAELRVRQALAPKLFDREYPWLSPDEIRTVNETAAVVVAVIQLHFTGSMSPLCVIEREELSDPEPEEAA